MIISASRRTDIPNFYSEWFFNRIKDGFVYVRNPINKNQVSEISLLPEAVDCIVFWTKNPKPMLDKLDRLVNYKYYFQFTLTSYGNDIEKNLASKNDEIIDTFKELSDKIGKERVIWRYDPILLTEKYSIDYHAKYFEKLAKKLHGYTDKCIISFIDIYSKVKRNAKEFDLFELNQNQIKSISQILSNVSSIYNFDIETCGEKVDLSEFNIGHAKCIDDKLMSKIVGYDIKYKKDKNQRLPCGCIESVDIGAYNTCINNCAYCYANYSEKVIEKSKELFDVHSPILCDTIKDSDIINKKKISNQKDTQFSLFK